MKRPFLIFATLTVVVILVLAGATYGMGILTEKVVKTYSEDLEKSATLSAINLDVETYERGFAKSSFTSSITADATAESFPLKHEVFHGPVAFTPDGMKAGYSYIISTLDLDALPEESKKNVQSVYGDTPPLTVRTTVELDGDRESIVTVAAVNHETDEMTLRFDGGKIEYFGDLGESSASGKFEFSPLKLQTHDENGDDFRLRLGGATATFSGEKNRTVSMSGQFDEILLRTVAEEPVNASVDTIELTMDYAPIGGNEGVRVGSASVSIPSFEVEVVDKGSVNISGIKIANQSSSENGNLIKYEVSYRAEAFKANAVEANEEFAWLKTLESGFEFAISSTIPRPIVEDFATFQQTQAAMPATSESFAASQTALAELMEGTLRKLNRGTALTLDARVGPEKEGVNLNLNLAYEEERPVTSRKNYLQLLEALKLSLAASVPKTILDDAPQIEEQLQGLKATGMIKETLSGYEAAITATEGKVAVNGEPNPLIEQMAPLLMAEIPWDGIFEGMRMAAESKALRQQAADEEE